MRQYYYCDQAGQQIGPVPEEEIVKLLAGGGLSIDVPVWSEGFASWTSARNVDELMQKVSAISPQIAVQPGTNSALAKNTPSRESQAWLRLLARFLDQAIFAFIITVPVVMVFPKDPKGTIILMFIVSLFLYNFVEPALFALFGTTFGKALLRIQVTRNDGGRPSYGEVLKRAFRVWGRGEAIGFGLIAIFTLMHSYKDLVRDGITSWDKDGNFQVSHQKPEVWRVILAVAIVVLLRA